MNIKRVISICFIFSLPFYYSFGQDNDAILKDSGWSVHFQLTGVLQGHTSFQAPYSGQNSLQPASEKEYSVTSTLFIGRKLWKGAALYFNPEMAGGSGISRTLGIAGFPNGETFRIGDPEPTVYIARIFLRQHIALGGSQIEEAEDASNQVHEKIPSSRITLNFGKFCLADFFDDNIVSHDPRTDFMNWAFMNNGAYDYPANTRGYTLGFEAELVKPQWALRVATALVPTYANGPDLDEHYFKANGETLEFEKPYALGKKKGKIRLLGYFNVSKAPYYNEVVAEKENGTDSSLDVIYGKSYGGKKFGIGLNAEQELNESVKMFLRGGWNDGKTPSWAFAEIDNTFSAGIRIGGKGWNRAADNIGIAFLSNGISSDHRNFLNAGGYGFMIGDGKLPNYGRENIAEVFYSSKIYKGIWATLDYQFVNHPAYNLDRGPVHVFAARVHIEL
ncbi:MAG: carbohydrate porin [Chitinophagales bacterium]